MAQTESHDVRLKHEMKRKPYEFLNKARQTPSKLTHT